MRINFVLPVVNLSGGIRVLALYAEGLRRRGHQVTAVSVRLPGPTLKGIVKSLLKGRGWPRRPPVESSHFDNLAITHRRLDHAGPVTDADVPEGDVVIGTWWETVRWVERLSPSRGAKVHFVQGYDYGGRPEEIDATYALPIPKIVISSWLRDLVQNKFHQMPLAVISNSVSTDRFFAPPRGKQPVPTVGTIYATDRNKGADIALQAFELAAQRLPNLRLRTMGTAPVADDLPLPAGAEFTYNADDEKLRQVYSGCDAWLFSSRIEGFGLPILEALACRTPVIAAPAGAAPDLVNPGNGILVGAADPQALADAIVRVCGLPEAEWRALSDAALATITGYTWDDAVGRFEKALVELAEKTHGASR